MEIEVKNCSDCPFMTPSFDGDEAWCSKAKEPPVLFVDIHCEPPKECPLRKEPITIKLKS